MSQSQSSHRISFRSARLLPGVLALLLTAATAHAQRSAANQLAVDASEVTRGIIHVRATLSAQPGPFTLIYPEWIPGHHRQSGPISNIVGLKLIESGKSIPWRRDDVDMYSFHCTLPPGATTLEATFDYVSPQQASSLTTLNWDQVVLYTKGPKSDDLPFSASLKLPRGWKSATALPIAFQSADQITYKPVSLTTLVDSPVLVGAHFKSVPINPNQSPPHFLDMVSDSDSALELKPEIPAQYGKLVDEAGALFGVRHYTQYHWLISLATRVGGGGLEHHESSDDRVEENAWQTDAGRRRLAGLLAHEYIHSWCGKYRRPEGLATPDYHEPMKGELLWVYEGLTEYLATIICPRAGLVTAEDYRERLAETAGTMDHTLGRAWRPLADTAIAAPISYSSPGQWRFYRRGTDFYPEGILLWLEVDVMIRKQTQNKKSLNDFCLKFFGGPGGKPSLKPYTLDEVLTTLSEAAPYDWKTFLNTRLTSTEPHAPLAGITTGGWKLIYTDTPSDDIKYRETQQKVTNLTYSLGLILGNDDSTVRDIVPGMAADKAGLAPGMKLIAVNGRKWTPELLKTAVKESKTATAPLTLLVEDNEFYKTLALDYHQGHRYPHLERDASTPDVLTEIAKPLAAKP